MPAKTSLSPVLYIPHGGGPLPLLGDPDHQGLVTFLQQVIHQFEIPHAIVVISAHWEADIASVTGSKKPSLIYDYSGFPELAYKIQYPASGEPELACKILSFLQAAGINGRIDQNRGFDHGLFIPLKLMYPAANIPCLQLSLLKNLDPAQHIALGKSLYELRKHNVLVIGSGMSFHNLSALFSHDSTNLLASQQFDNWLVETCTSAELSIAEKENRLTNWIDAPGARYSHPREEHLLPLHVCFGMTCNESSKAKLVFNEPLLGHMVSGFLWH